MIRATVATIALLGCGDNRAAPDATPDDSGPTCVVAGKHVAFARVFWGCSEPTNPMPAPDCLDSVVTLATAPPDDPRLFLVEIRGRIRIAEHGKLRAQPFLDLTPDNGGPVNGTGLSEQGLLGLAFHPRYATNRQFFVYYTRDNPDLTDTAHPYLDVVARYTASASDPSTADPASGVELIAIPDPYSNHNGGMIEFGLDGLLYISDGDGGGVSGTMNGRANAQDPDVMLGKMLRIDVDHEANGKPYAIPGDNPYAITGGLPEVFIRGLRNPWRWSFDRATGDMYIGDVGEGTIEEIDVLRAGDQAGKNLGWSMWEGDSCFAPPCDATGITFPAVEHTHADGWWAIIGGEVYRGACYPDLVGDYFYSDTGHGGLYDGKLQPDGTLAVTALPGDTFGNYGASLHADASGELFMTKVDGGVFQLIVLP